MSDLDSKAPPAPPFPRLQLGPYRLQPKRTEWGTVETDMWVLPGRTDISTTDALQLARQHAWALAIILN